MSANVLRPEPAPAAASADRGRSTLPGVARAEHPWRHWPLPDGPWRRVIDGDTAPPACQVQLDTRHFVNGRLLAIDLEQRRLHWAAADSDRAIALPFAAFRCLRLMALQPAEPPDSPAWRPPPPAVSFRVEFTDGRAWSGSTYRVADDSRGLFLFEPVDDVGNLRLAFVPSSAWRALRFGAPLRRADAAARHEHRDGPPTARRAGAPRLGQVLIELGLISQPQLLWALAAQRVNRNLPLGELLVRQGALTRAGLELALATKSGQPISATAEV